MSHTYRYGNKEHTQIVRDDGAAVEIERHRSLVDMTGHFAEQFRLDGGVVAPHKPHHVAAPAPEPAAEPVGFMSPVHGPFGVAPEAPRMRKLRAKK